MFYFLILIAVIFFITHLVLLLTAFPQSTLANKRYFYSHVTLWVTGLIVFVMAFLYAGSGRSGFLDYFNTPIKMGMIIIFTLVLSLVAHLIVRFLVLPLLERR